MGVARRAEPPAGPPRGDEPAPGAEMVVDVSVRWQGELLSLRRLGEGERATLGEGPDALVALELEGLSEGDARPLAWVEAGRATAWVPEGARARIAEEGGVTRLAFAGRRYDLEAGATLSLRLGDVELSVEALRALRPRRAPAWLGWSTFAKALVVAGYAALVAAAAPFLLSGPDARPASPALSATLEVQAALAAARARAAP